MSFPGHQAETMAAVLDPQVGDRFHEMYGWWVYVVARHGDRVVTMESGAPCTFPDDAKVEGRSLAEWIAHATYDSMRDKSWLMLADRGNQVVGWWKPEITGVPDEWIAAP